MLLFFVRFLFGFALSLAGALLLALATWLCLRLIAIAISLISDRRAQDAANAAIVLTVIAIALASLYGVGHALYAYLGAWPTVSQTDDWLAGPRLISPEAILGALVGLGGLAASPGIWRWRVRSAEARANAPTEPTLSRSMSDNKFDNSDDKPAKPARAAAKSSAKPSVKTSTRAASNKTNAASKRPTIPRLGWLAIFLLAIGGVLLAFALIVAPVAPAGNLSGPPHDDSRFLPIYACALTVLGCGLLCLLLWRFYRRAPAADAP